MPLNRLVTGLVLGSLLLVALLAPVSWPIIIYTFVILVFVTFEFNKLSKFNPVIYIVNFILFITSVFFYQHFPLDVIKIIFGVFLLYVLCVLKTGKDNVVGSYLTNIVYISFGLALIPIVVQLNIHYAFMFFLSVICTDTFAYVFGIKYGKHKLAPKISPKKSIEGSVAGIIVTLIVVLLYNIFISKYAFVDAVFFAFFVSIITQIGDLYASQIKRIYLVKDFGNILPGHGGFLDRIDGLLLATIVIVFGVL